jgi:hypothetical protein
VVRKAHLPHQLSNVGYGRSTQSLSGHIAVVGGKFKKKAMRFLGLFFLMILFFLTGLFGQGKEFSIVDTIIYKTTDLDSIPEFNYPKGDLQKDKIRAYIKDNQLWPTQDDGVFFVYIRFVVEKNGTTSNITVFKGIRPDFDNEAIRLIKTMPTWKPGKKIII